MKTIVYFGSDSKAALNRVAHIRALNGDDAAQAISAEAFVGERIKADEIEFMPDVPGWHRVRIDEHFAKQKARDAAAAEEAARKREGLPPKKIVSEEDFRRSMTSQNTDTVTVGPEGDFDTVQEAVDAVSQAEASPLDHDGDGTPGGSLPAAERGLDDLKAAYEAKFGKAPDKRWGEKRLLKELGE